MNKIQANDLYNRGNRKKNDKKKKKKLTKSEYPGKVNFGNQSNY